MIKQSKLNEDPFVFYSLLQNSVETFEAFVFA
jgi:hypothetical protein